MATTFFTMPASIDQILTNQAAQSAQLVQVLANLATIISNQSVITENERTLMSALTDLQAAVAAVGTAVNNLNAPLQTAIGLLQQIAGGDTVSSTDAEAAVTALNAASAQLATDVQNLTAAEPGP